MLLIILAPRSWFDSIGSSVLSLLSQPFRAAEEGEAPADQGEGDAKVCVDHISGWGVRCE